MIRHLWYCLGAGDPTAAARWLPGCPYPTLTGLGKHTLVGFLQDGRTTLCPEMNRRNSLFEAYRRPDMVDRHIPDA